MKYVLTMRDVCAFALLAATVGMSSTAPHAQSLGDIAKAEAERRAAIEAKEPTTTTKATPSTTDSADKTGKTDKADTTAKTEKTDNRAKKIYTNADLAPVTDNKGVARNASASAPASSVRTETATETAEMKAKRLLSFELDRIAFKIRNYVINMQTTNKMCDPGSYLGLTGGSLEGHREFCQDSLREIDGQKANIDQLVNELQGRARQEGILPGTARDLVKAMGWP